MLVQPKRDNLRYPGEKTTKIFEKMSNILKVKKPFFVMEVDDTFELSEDGTEYVSSFNMERNEGDDHNSVVTSKYSSRYAISKEYAQKLVEDGFLEEVKANTIYDKKFVNVFDEISSLIQEYTEDLENLDDTMADQPACLKVESETVLRNLLTVLNHLNSLKK